MDISNITNARWLNKHKTRLECMYKHAIYGWIPFTADISDKSSVSRDIFSVIDRLRIEDYVEPSVDIEALREAKHLELRQARENARITEFAVYDSDVFQIRQEDQDNLNTFYSDSVAMLSGIVEREVFVIMSATNRPHTLTPEQVVQLAKVMKSKVEEIYSRYWYARDVLLANAKTKEEIEKIKLPDSIPV